MCASSVHPNIATEAYSLENFCLLLCLLMSKWTARPILHIIKVTILIEPLGTQLSILEHTDRLRCICEKHAETH